TALDLTNLALIGRLGTEALSGVGAATQLIQLGVAALAAVSVGGMVLVAQASGAGDARAAGRVAGQSLLVCLAIGLAIGLPAALFATQLLRAIGTSPAVAAQGAVYLRLAALAFPALGVMTVGAALMRGSGDSRTPMSVTGLTNLINVALSAGLIFGPPHLGVAGAAWGAATARTSGAFLLAAALWRSGRLRGARARLDRGLLRRLLGIGLPSMAEQVILSLGMLAYGFLALRLGTATYAAQRVCLTLIGVAWMPAFGYGAAATALVGQAVGAGDAARAQALARAGAGHAIAWMSGLAVVCFAFASPLLGLFTADPAVRAAGATGLRVLCFGQPLWGLGQVYAGALRGTGDTRYPMWATSAGVWLVRMPTALICGYLLGLGLPGIFVSNGVDAGARAALVTRRFLTGRWRERVGRGSVKREAWNVTSDER
ncbi:MAG TPA: MATE family efflux transporter, partial [Vicinamibacteria bacterium]